MSEPTTNKSADEGSFIANDKQLWQAAKDGDLETVRALVEGGAEVNNLARDEDNPTTSLFQACHAGHFDVVHYLLEHGADLEITSALYETTCLAVACWAMGDEFGMLDDEMLEEEKLEKLKKQGQYTSIVRLLLEKGADVNKIPPDGRTALHLAAWSEHTLPIIQVLCEHGARSVKDSEGMTPLITAVRKICLLGTVDPYPPVVEYLINRPDLTHAERVDAFLLLGAIAYDEDDAELAMTKWKQALEEVEVDRRKREEKKRAIVDLTAGESPASVEEDPGPWCPPAVEPIKACNYAVESRSLAELEALSGDGLKMQALLIRERVFGPGHEETLNHFRCLGQSYEMEGDVARCLDLWLHALDLVQTHRKPMHLNVKQWFREFLDLFLGVLVAANERIRVSVPPGQVLPECLLEYMLVVLDKAVLEINRVLSQNTETPAQGIIEFKKLPSLIVQLLVMIQRAIRIGQDLDIRSLSNTSVEAQQRLKPILCNIMEKNPSDKRGRTLLHLACDDSLISKFEEDYTYLFLRDKGFIEILLECGSEVNAIDHEGNTPLHVAALSCVSMSKKVEEVTDAENAPEIVPTSAEDEKKAEDPTITAAKLAHGVEVMRVLAEHGAKLDARNEAGQTAGELLQGVKELSGIAGMSWLEERFKMLPVA